MTRTYADWREPFRLLQLETGPAAASQIDLGAKLGLKLDEGVPHDVAGAMLEDVLEPLVWARTPEPASDRQLAFLQDLRGTGPVEPALSKRVASAWIDHFLKLRTIKSLSDLHLTSGDVVVKTTRYVDQESGEILEGTHEFVVSSIGPSGLVYFRGGNGQCAWPSTLKHAESHS